MWIRKSIMLCVLMASSSIYGFGSSDLEELKGLFEKQEIEIEMKEICHDGEEKHEQEGSMYDIAKAILAVLMG